MIEILAVLGTLTVCAASFSASWHGLRLLAISVGIPVGQAWVLPVSLDGLQLVASMVILTRQRAGRPARWAWWIVVVATVLSAGGNAVAAPRTLLGMAVWGVLPILLAAAWHLLAGIVEDTLKHAADPASTLASTHTEGIVSRPPMEYAPPVIDGPPDLARVVHATCDRLAADGREVTWRSVVDAAPVLAGPHGYARADRSVQARIRSWERAKSRPLD